jgi:hypothetical protein
LALIGYLTAAIGLPVPEAGHYKPGAVSFPCQNHACGCLTAEQCWQSCCCFNHEEKMAWAEAHQVQPPAAATRLACANGWNVPRLRDQEHQAPPTQTTKAPCCSGHGAATESAATPPPSAKPLERTTRWVIGMQAQQCRGLGILWLSGEPVSAPPPLIEWCHETSPVCWLQPSCQRTVATVLVPPTPPPRG